MKLPEPILKHSVGVAEFMADYAEKHNADPFRYYVTGLLHDIGKLFPNKTETRPYKGHAQKGGELLRELGFNNYKEILHHGHPEDGYFSTLWLVLNLADLSINGKGETIPIAARLTDIRQRYGEESEEYDNAIKMTNILIDNHIIRKNYEII